MFFPIVLDALDFSFDRIFFRRSNTGPGRKTLYTVHKMIGRSRYTPHQNTREMERRKRQMAASKQRETA